MAVKMSATIYLFQGAEVARGHAFVGLVQIEPSVANRKTPRQHVAGEPAVGIETGGYVLRGQRAGEMRQRGDADTRFEAGADDRTDSKFDRLVGDALATANAAEECRFQYERRGPRKTLGEPVRVAAFDDGFIESDGQIAPCGEFRQPIRASGTYPAVPRYTRWIRPGRPAQTPRRRSMTMRDWRRA